MPRRAYMWNKEGEPVEASDVSVNHRNAIFLCCTRRCQAEMLLCKVGTNDAYFRSKHKEDHISIDCVKNSIIFRPDKYDETLFNLDFAFESILGKNHTIQTINRGTTGTKQGNVGNNRRIRIHTLATLYSMCISKNKDETYNGFLIDDILADNENYEKYADGIEGYKIVETSFYFFNDKDCSATLNYPVNNKGKNSWVKIIFKNRALYKKHKRKLMDSNHIEPIIIAGEWEIALEGSKHHSQCIIHKESQIHYPKLE